MKEIKLGALRRFCLAAIPEMRKLQWGRIVNISSIGGIYPNPKLLISHALSAAINNITKSLALEVAKDGILVNAIGIGAVATDNWANNMIPAVRRERSEFAEFTDEVVIALQSCGDWLVRDRENPSGWHIRHRSSGLRAGL